VDITHNQTLEEMDRRTILHPATNLNEHASGAGPDPVIMERGQGIRVTDHKGRSFIDAFAGLYCVNIGYGRTEVADAIAAQARKLAYYHVYRGNSTEALIRLSDKVLRLAPEGMSKIFYGLSGSDANETNVKLAWYYNNVRGRPKKKKIIARKFAYHGTTIMSGSLTGLEAYHVAFDLPIDRVLHTTAPHFYRFAEPGMTERDFARKCAADLEALIQREGPDTVAAFIGEPAMGTGGLIPPPEGYWEEIQKVLARHDVLLIADEVICGFGRTGRMFGSHTYGIKPDLISVAKGLTSAYAPLSGSMVNEKVWSALAEGSAKYGNFSHGFTYSAHPLGAAAALANLEIVEREDLAGNAARTGAHLQRRLREKFGNHPMVGEVRGVGLMAALEFVADRRTKARFDAGLKVSMQIGAACQARGLIVRAMPHGETIGFAPPLVITPSDVDEVVDIVDKAVREVMDGLVREKSWKAA